jgi:hypothetical protein
MDLFHPIIKFTVSIQPDPVWMLLGTNDRHISSENMRSTFIPGLFAANNFVGRNGDSITLGGSQALYYKKLIDEGKIKDLIYTMGTGQSVSSTGNGGINSMFINNNAINSKKVG